MLYCYLTDTALSPFLTNQTTNVDQALVNYREKTGFQYSDSRWTGGVGQLTERVISMFNTEYIEQITDHDGNLKYQQYPNVVMDPRIADNGNTDTTQQTYLTNRLLGLFDPNSSVTGTLRERAVGEMQLHYDAYLAAKDNNVKGNFIAALANDVTNNIQFAQVFNIIEYCLLAHEYNARDNCWIFKSTNAINEYLAANPGLFGAGSETAKVNGYIYNSVTMPLVDLANNKTAKVRNINTESTTGAIKTNIGTTVSTASSAKILFPDYIQFAYRFSKLEEVTWFRVYLNPEAFIKSYTRSTITHIVCPAKPVDLVNLSYDSIEVTLASTSRYVAELISGEVTKTDTDTLQTTNFTGAANLVTRYIPKCSSNTIATRYNFTFSCIYKGRKPNTAEQKRAVRELLESANDGKSVKDIFPDLYTDNNFIIVPMYDTRIVTDTNANVTYCSNIYKYESLINNYNGYQTCLEQTDETLSAVRRVSSMFDVPAYFMHALVYPEVYTSDVSSSVVRFDEISEFKSYQPISSTDVYWGTMSDEAREFNQLITKIVAYQLTGYRPAGMDDVIEETKAIFKSSTTEEMITRTYLSFTVGAYGFSVMTRESYINNFNYILTLDTVFLANKQYYTRTGQGTAESPYVYRETSVVVGENIPANTYYERVSA